MQTVVLRASAIPALIHTQQLKLKDRVQLIELADHLKVTLRVPVMTDVQGTRSVVLEREHKSVVHQTF